MFLTLKHGCHLQYVISHLFLQHATTGGCKYIHRYLGAMQTAIYLRFLLFALHKSFKKSWDPHETRNASDPWYFPLSCNWSFPPNIFPAMCFLDWTLMFLSKGFLGMWSQLTLVQIGLSFHGLWLGHTPAPSPSGQQHETTTSDSCMCYRSPHFLNILKPALQWAPYFPTHLHVLLLSTGLCQL